MGKQIVDILTGTTEYDIDWRMLNMNAELVASSLSLTLAVGSSHAATLLEIQCQ